MKRGKEVTSARVATIAARGLKTGVLTKKEIKTVCASVLTQKEVKKFDPKKLRLRTLD